MTTPQTDAINQSINQSVNQSINQSVNQSIFNLRGWHAMYSVVFKTNESVAL